jgi:hypothetical protein
LTTTSRRLRAPQLDACSPLAQILFPHDRNRRVIKRFPGIRYLAVKVGNLQSSTEAIRFLWTRLHLDPFSLWLVPGKLARLTTFFKGLGPAYAPQYVDPEPRNFYSSWRGRLPRPGDRLNLFDDALQSRNSWFRLKGWTDPYAWSDATRCNTCLRRQQAARSSLQAM